MYELWLNCMNLGIYPPDVKATWEACSPEIQAMIIAFDQIVGEY